MLEDREIRILWVDIEVDSDLLDSDEEQLDYIADDDEKGADVYPLLDEEGFPLDEPGADMIRDQLAEYFELN